MFFEQISSNGLGLGNARLSLGVLLGTSHGPKGHPVSDTLKQSTHSPTIAAAKVEGSAVFDPRGERIGTIKDIYINKRTGEAEFVSMADGGVFGIGEKHHRLPWSALSYDNDLGGYLIGLEKATLKAGPVFADDLAGALLFLCGRGGAYTTGCILPLDGGMHVSTRPHMYSSDE